MASSSDWDMDSRSSILDLTQAENVDEQDELHDASSIPAIEDDSTLQISEEQTPEGLSASCHSCDPDEPDMALENDVSSTIASFFFHDVDAEGLHKVTQNLRVETVEVTKTIPVSGFRVSDKGYCTFLDIRGWKDHEKTADHIEKNMVYSSQSMKTRKVMMMLQGKKIPVLQKKRNCTGVKVCSSNDFTIDADVDDFSNISDEQMLAMIPPQLSDDDVSLMTSRDAYFWATNLSFHCDVCDSETNGMESFDPFEPRDADTSNLPTLPINARRQGRRWIARSGRIGRDGQTRLPSFLGCKGYRYDARSALKHKVIPFPSNFANVDISTIEEWAKRADSGEQMPPPLPERIRVSQGKCIVLPQMTRGKYCRSPWHGFNQSPLTTKACESASWIILVPEKRPMFAVVLGFGRHGHPQPPARLAAGNVESIVTKLVGSDRFITIGQAATEIVNSSHGCVSRPGHASAASGTVKRKLSAVRASRHPLGTSFSTLQFMFEHVQGRLSAKKEVSASEMYVRDVHLGPSEDGGAHFLSVICADETLLHFAAKDGRFGADGTFGIVTESSISGDVRSLDTCNSSQEIVGEENRSNSPIEVMGIVGKCRVTNRQVTYCRQFTTRKTKQSRKRLFKVFFELCAAKGMKGPKLQLLQTAQTAEMTFDSSGPVPSPIPTTLTSRNPYHRSSATGPVLQASATGPAVQLNASGAVLQSSSADSVLYDRAGPTLQSGGVDTEIGRQAAEPSRLLSLSTDFETSILLAAAEAAMEVWPSQACCVSSHCNNECVDRYAMSMGYGCRWHRARFIAQHSGSSDKESFRECMRAEFYTSDAQAQALLTRMEDDCDMHFGHPQSWKGVAKWLRGNKYAYMLFFPRVGKEKGRILSDRTVFVANSICESGNAKLKRRLRNITRYLQGCDILGAVAICMAIDEEDGKNCKRALQKGSAGDVSHGASMWQRSKRDGSHVGRKNDPRVQKGSATHVTRVSASGSDEQRGVKRQNANGTPAPVKSTTKKKRTGGKKNPKDSSEDRLSRIETALEGVMDVLSRSNAGVPRHESHGGTPIHGTLPGMTPQVQAVPGTAWQYYHHVPPPQAPARTFSGNVPFNTSSVPFTPASGRPEMAPLHNTAGPVVPVEAAMTGYRNIIPAPAWRK